MVQHLNDHGQVCGLELHIFDKILLQVVLILNSGPLKTDGDSSH